MKLRYSARTDVGKKREINEDSYGPPEPPQEGVVGQLMVVCDGMGGHASGEIASSIGVETILQTYYANHDEDRATVLRDAFEQANQRIFEQGHGTMGTTGVAALLHRDKLYIANVGDSRAYLVHNGTIRQVSRDHSYVSEQVQAGLLTPEQARTSLVRNIITRALGHQPEVKVDIFTVPVAESDVVILSSDGMHGLVDDEEIQQAVMHLPPEKATSALINLANQRGGVDNITVIVAQVERMDGPTVFDGTTHTLPAVTSNVAPTERLPAPKPSAAETLTIPPTPARAPTDKFPTIVGQQAVRPQNAPPPAAPPPAATPPPAAPGSPRTPPAAERQGTGLGFVLAALLLVLLLAVVGWLFFGERALALLGGAPPAATAAPTDGPNPTGTATAAPTTPPTAQPTAPPTAPPTAQPTAQPTLAPTGNSGGGGAATQVPSTSRTPRPATPSGQATATRGNAEGDSRNVLAVSTATATRQATRRVVAATRTATRIPTEVASPTSQPTEAPAQIIATVEVVYTEIIPTVADLLGTENPLEKLPTVELP